MTTSQFIACAFAWFAAIAAIVGAVLSFRAQQQARAVLFAVRAQRRTFPWKGGEITVTAPMSEAEYEAFRARWHEEYGQPGAIVELSGEGEPDA